jgi:hypothetical protein
MAPFFIYHYGVNPEVYPYVIPKEIGEEVGKDVFFYRAEPAVPGASIQSFEIAIQPEMMPIPQQRA